MGGGGGGGGRGQGGGGVGEAVSKFSTVSSVSLNMTQV